jgi:hypothetical protein
VTQAEALRAVQQGLPDDAAKLRLTVIGANGDRTPVEQELAKPESKDIADRALLWSVPPDHWSLKDHATGQPMFVTTGKPTVYLQAPSGEVLYREDDYRQGDFTAIRKAIDDYDKRKDPGRSSPAALPFDFKQIPPAAWVVAGVGLLILGRRFSK